MRPLPRKVEEKKKLWRGGTAGGSVGGGLVGGGLPLLTAQGLQASMVVVVLFQKLPAKKSTFEALFYSALSLSFLKEDC